MKLKPKIKGETTWDRFNTKRFQALCRGKVNVDYGFKIIVLAERWAGLMEWHMARGRKLADVAQSTSDKLRVTWYDSVLPDGRTFGEVYRLSKRARPERLTFQLLESVGDVLVEFWEHGEELRRWYRCQQRSNDLGPIITIRIRKKPKVTKSKPFKRPTKADLRYVSSGPM